VLDLLAVANGISLTSSDGDAILGIVGNTVKGESDGKEEKSRAGISL